MISSIQQLTSGIADLNNKTNIVTKTSDSAFVDALNAAKALIEETNNAEMVTDELTRDFIMGKNDNIHSLMIAQEKSSILLQFTMQVRNQLMDAYREIMRISV